MLQLNEKQRIAVEDPAKFKAIVAPAGSGKTKTLISAILDFRNKHTNDKIVAITFTRKAAAELKERLGVILNAEVSTIHSWSWKRLQDLAVKYDFKVQLLDDDAIKDILKRICRASQQYYLNQFQLFAYVMGNYNIDIDDAIKRTFERMRQKYIAFKKQHQLYDFTDLPQYLYDKLQEYNEEIYDIDGFFVDEFQDIDPVQLSLFNVVHAHTKVYIGDQKQCQPAGTRVLVRDKGYVNIEDIQVGDSLVYYDRKQGYLSGLTSKSANCVHKRVLQTSCTEYRNDYLVTVTTNEGNRSSYTSGHRTFVKLNQLANKHVVYLMCDKNYRFRVGKIALGRTNGTNSWRTKLKDENCEKIWLLKIFDNDLDARIEEAKISYTYGIPQLCWQTDKVLWTKEAIDYIYKDIDIFERSSRCLQDYKRDIRFPLLDFSIDWLANNHFTTNSTCLIYAINIMEEYMSCLAYGSETSHSHKHFETITSVERAFIDTPIPVYSLEVDGGTYVADNLVTHNCIYHFRGSINNVFEILRKDGFSFFELNVNYRSYQSIIDAAESFYNFANSALTTDSASVVDILNSGWDGITPSEIICNKGEGGGVYFLPSIGSAFDDSGKKYAPNLLLKKLLADKGTQILCRANKQVKKIKALGIESVSTIHQAKGLEYDNVILIDFPFNDEEGLNIAYVGMTRAKNILCIADFDVLLYLICNEELTLPTNKLF